jgi:hypothetical protein
MKNFIAVNAVIVSSLLAKDAVAQVCQPNSVAKQIIVCQSDCDEMPFRSIGPLLGCVPGDANTHTVAKKQNNTTADQKSHTSLHVDGVPAGYAVTGARIDDRDLNILGSQGYKGLEILPHPSGLPDWILIKAVATSRCAPNVTIQVCILYRSNEESTGTGTKSLVN